jgi:hypothetical protein
MIDDESIGIVCKVSKNSFIVRAEVTAVAADAGAQVWRPTFGWGERWKLFLQAPITLFYANVIVSILATTVFTSW